MEAASIPDPTGIEKLRLSLVPSPTTELLEQSTPVLPSKDIGPHFPLHPSYDPTAEEAKKAYRTELLANAHERSTKIQAEVARKVALVQEMAPHIGKRLVFNLVDGTQTEGIFTNFIDAMKGQPVPQKHNIKNVMVPYVAVSNPVEQQVLRPTNIESFQADTEGLPYIWDGDNT